MTTNNAQGGEHQSHHSAEPRGQNKLMSALAYLGILVLIPFLTDAKKDPVVKFHIKQGFVLLILEVIGWFVNRIPYLGWPVGALISLVTLILAIIGIINVVNGHEKELPLIGQYAKNFNF